MRRFHRDYYEKEETKALYQSSLEKFRRGAFEESSGRLIADLFDIKPTKELVRYTKRWLSDYPNHEYAPKLVGIWLEETKSNDASYFAAKYVQRVKDPQSLALILMAAGKQPQRRHLLNAIQRRFERQPHHQVWGNLEIHEVHNKSTDSFIKNWLDVNKDNAAIAASVSTVVLFTNNPDTLEAALRWADSRKEAEWFVANTFVNFLSEQEPHLSLRPRVLSAAWRWFQTNRDHEGLGLLVNRLAQTSESLSKLDTLKDWYFEHRDDDTSTNALIGLLLAYLKLGVDAHPGLVESALSRLRVPIDARPHGLLIPMLEIQPSQEISGMMREACLNMKASGLIMRALLKGIADDEAVLCAGYKLLAENSPYGAGKLLFALLEKDTDKQRSTLAAKKWLRKNRDHKQFEAIRSKLAEMSK
ncbi:MAG TPA: hypothetical protein V6C81_28720 [Planktothrix sp.]|jgi:hypothetical protein